MKTKKRVRGVLCVYITRLFIRAQTLKESVFPNLLTF